MELVAALADAFSFGEIRVTHEQNLVLADVRKDCLHELWQRLRPAGLATPNLGLLTDIVCCPGGDFCSLANAKSIPVAEAIQRRFEDLDYLHDLGEIDLNISGCMNACGHHHVGHIGILGVDKKGQEFYQILLGGNQGHTARLGTILGPSFAHDAVPEVIARILALYLEKRVDGETFLDTCVRIGIEPFRETVYGQPHQG
jgi:sulfite reductase (NADPH) hemoprotein beta-component